MMGRKKDTKSAKKNKGARSGVRVVPPLPMCHSGNILVQEVWDSLAPALIQAGVVHGLNAHIFTQYCGLLVLCQAQAAALIDGDELMINEVLAYDETGATYKTKTESGASKMYRQYLSQIERFAKFFSLRPKDMAGLYNINAEDDDDIFAP
jgi:hypothetical protein